MRPTVTPVTSGGSNAWTDACTTGTAPANRIANSLFPTSDAARARKFQCAVRVKGEPFAERNTKPLYGLDLDVR